MTVIDDVVVGIGTNAVVEVAATAITKFLKKKM